MEIRDIPGFIGYKATSEGTIIGKRGRELGCFKSKYVMIGLGKGKTPSQRHKLIALAFVPNPDNKSEVDHIDKNKHNDIPSNLRWVDRYDNMANRNVLSHSATQIKGLRWVNPYGESITGRWRCTIQYKHVIYINHFHPDKKQEAIEWLENKRKQLNI
jgi:hypothetical protein